MRYPVKKPGVTLDRSAVVDCTQARHDEDIVKLFDIIYRFRRTDNYAHDELMWVKNYITIHNYPLSRQTMAELTAAIG